MISVFRWHDIINKNPKRVCKNLLELIKKIQLSGRYKTNVQKPIVSLYTNNEVSGKEIKKIPFILVSIRIKYLGINLTKQVKESNKTLMGEIWKDTNKLKNTPCSWVGRINIVKMFIILKAIYRFSIIPFKILMVHFYHDF